MNVWDGGAALTNTTGSKIDRPLMSADLVQVHAPRGQRVLAVARPYAERILVMPLRDASARCTRAPARRPVDGEATRRALLEWRGFCENACL